MPCRLEDFGGHHPDPNPVNAAELIARMMARDDAPDFGAASDGDGDRNMIVGRKFDVTPSDAAVLAANATVAPGYARDSKALPARCRPARRPTAWRRWAIQGLRDADGVEILRQSARCRPGDDVRGGSSGTGSDHIREKDGVWAVLVLAEDRRRRRKSVEEMAGEHWAGFGRNDYTRHDYEEVEIEAATRADGCAARAARPCQAGASAH